MSLRNTVVLTTVERSAPACCRMAREVLHHLLRLRGDVAVHELHGLRVERHLAGGEDEAVGHDGLAVGADGGGRVVGVHGLHGRCHLAKSAGRGGGQRDGGGRHDRGDGGALHRGVPVASARTRTSRTNPVRRMRTSVREAGPGKRPLRSLRLAPPPKTLGEVNFGRPCTVAAVSAPRARAPSPRPPPPLRGGRGRTALPRTAPPSCRGCGRVHPLPRSLWERVGEVYEPGRGPRVRAPRAQSPATSPSASMARTSSGVTTATPGLPTSIPAARFASTAASSIVAPAARATARKAVTVSPAPLTS